MDGWKGAWCLPLELVEVHLYLYPEQNGLWCVNANTNSDSAYFFFFLSHHTRFFLVQFRQMHISRYEYEISHHTSTKLSTFWFNYGRTT